MSNQNLLFALHNTNSPNTVKLFANTVVNFPFLCKNIIFSKITASAASMGIPDAQKIILGSEKQGSLFFFADINDIIDSLNPDKIYLLVPRRFGQTVVPFFQISQEIKKIKALIIVGGSSSGLTRKELDMGECIYLEHETPELNPIALTAIFLYGLLQTRSE
ncbi:MAG: RecB-family nuclease [Candidatus Hodarchaeales archaeon]|jgi:SpoU rRNA methylase family enzyme